MFNFWLKDEKGNNRSENIKAFTDGPILDNAGSQLEVNSISSFCKMGYRPSKVECQDSYCIMVRYHDSCSYFAIYDGNGPQGKEASMATNDYVQWYLENTTAQHIGPKPYHNDVYQMLKACFDNTEEKLKLSKIDYSESGTCVSSVFIFKNYCYVSNIGNSRTVLYKHGENKQQAVQLSSDHNCKNEEERKRIHKHEGMIEMFILQNKPIGQFRVWNQDLKPGYVITRAIGDFNFKKDGIISDLEISQLELTKEDNFIVLGSDGLWDVMTNEEVQQLQGYIKIY